MVELQKLDSTFIQVRDKVSVSLWFNLLLQIYNIINAFEIYKYIFFYRDPKKPANSFQTVGKSCVYLVEQGHNKRYVESSFILELPCYLDGGINL
jgi:hypothetical protein